MERRWTRKKTKDRKVNQHDKRGYNQAHAVAPGKKTSRGAKLRGGEANILQLC